LGEKPNGKNGKNLRPRKGLKMPWKNPRCPKCKIGKSKKVRDSKIDPRKWVYKCTNCGHEFESWGHIIKRRRFI